MKFYTNCQVIGNRIFYRGVENGDRLKRTVDYFPSIFIPSNKESKYKTLDGRNVERLQPGDIKDTKEFIKRYDGVDNFEMFGNNQFNYCYLADEFPGVIEFDVSQIVVANIDIETGSENGFPDPETAREELLAITVKANGLYYVFGCGEFTTNDKAIKYILCKDEIELIHKFLDTWQLISPDVVTGWNIQFFDIPYLVNRITKLLGQKEAKRLSPWGFFTNRKTNYKGMNRDVVELVGISTLDYIEMYRKFQPRQESEKLNYIAYVELGEEKLNYSEYGSLHNLYKTDFQKFIEYNIKDVELIDKLDQKLQLISMVVSTAFDAKVNFSDVFAQVRMWDAIVFNHFKENNLVFPFKSHQHKDPYPGGYVKAITPGMYKWVVSFDLDSLYPHLIAQFNISPECLLPEEFREIVTERIDGTIDCSGLMSREIDLGYLVDRNLTIAANGHHFRRDRRGFFPDILMRMYEDRKLYKKKMIEAQKNLQVVRTQLKEMSTPELEQSARNFSFDVSKYNNYQLAKKVQLNSAYGAMGNEYFRFFDVRLASAVTISGQLVIQWIAKDLNKYLNNLLKTADKDYVIAIDTDSVYLTLDELVRTVYKNKSPSSEKIVTFVDKVSQDQILKIINDSVISLGKYLNVHSQKMRMKRESIAEKAIWTAKKRYMLNIWDNEGVRYSAPKLKIQGIEAIKSNTPEICRNAIKDAIKIAMDGTQDQLYDFIEDFKKKFVAAPVENVASPTQCNNLAEYSSRDTIYIKGSPMHVKGALVYNHMLITNKLTKQYKLIQEGDKVRHLQLKLPNPSLSPVIAFVDVLPKEIALHKYVDIDEQFQRVFLKPLSAILDAIQWKSERVANLDALF